jgi:hypothetical protein
MQLQLVRTCGLSRLCSHPMILSLVRRSFSMKLPFLGLFVFEPTTSSRLIVITRPVWISETTTRTVSIGIRKKTVSAGL